MDGRDAVAVRAWPARRLAGGGLRGAERFRENVWPAKAADPEAIRQDRREMASLPVGRRLVFLARARRVCARRGENKEPVRLGRGISGCVLSGAGCPLRASITNWSGLPFPSRHSREVSPGGQSVWAGRNAHFSS